MIKKIKNKIGKKIAAFAGAGGLIGGAGALGAFGACHTICMAVIAGLAVLGITVIGMPFLFMENPAFYIPFSVVGVALLGLSGYIWYDSNKKCKH